MASTPLAEDSYPDPLQRSGKGSAGLWRVMVLGLALVAVAVVFSLFSDRISPDVLMTFVGVLAVVGVFCLFGLAAGLFRFAGTEERRTLAGAVVDSLPFGAVVADRDGKIAYANAHYGAFAGAVTNGVPVGVPYNAGDTLTFVVNASEVVLVNGTPRLALDIGGTTVFADYVAGSGTTTMTGSSNTMVAYPNPPSANNLMEFMTLVATCKASYETIIGKPPTAALR